MTEIEQLEQAIAVLEGQRAVLGDAVVDAALQPMREKLALLRTTPASLQPSRKQVTVLFADLSGFTAISETLDAEEVTEIINALWTQLDNVITAHGGRIDKHIGDGVMALWGAETTREDDPERAVRAALEMQSALATLRQELAGNIPLHMHIGLNTGPALLGEVGTTHEFTAMGDTVNLASRLGQAAPIDGVLISHNTYRHVRGLFDVLPQPPLSVKGKAAPVQTYIVQRARPRAFRLGTRGVEGVETHMVGRETELLALQSAFADALGGQTRMLTVVGDAGVGKSRLLYEFEVWLASRPEPVDFLKGRAAPALQSIPYSIFRDAFAQRFDILESDSAAVVLDKFRVGTAGILSPEQADLVGHWIGFDFSASPAVKNLIGNPNFGNLAQTYLSQYVRAVADRQPLALFLEDLHWADDSSLDLIEHLVAAIPHKRLLVIGLARPNLFERHPHWGTGQPGQTQLVLQPLSRQDCLALVDEILQRVDAIPPALRDLIVEGAEGNPFYVEELVKMLADEGVIERAADAHGPWHINMERLEQTHVPPTLTGILQARLDSLPRPERELLQRAAVVGRLFWDATVAELANVEREQLGTPLDALQKREMVFQRAHSAFAGSDEYLFKHALLRDVTYETVLLKLRRRYHALVARWLEAHAGERIGEYAGLIADHLERAGLTSQAVAYLRQAADNARQVGALREAWQFSQRALNLLPEESQERPRFLIQASKLLMLLGDYGTARQQLEAALTLADKIGDSATCANALEWLGAVASDQAGDWPQARSYLEKSLALARQIGDRTRIASVLWNLGWVDIWQGAYSQARACFSESRALCQELGNRTGLVNALVGLGGAALYLGEYAEAQTLYLESLNLARESGARDHEAAILNCLGEVARLQRDWAAATSYYHQALCILREIDHKVNVATVLANLGHVTSASGDSAAAVPYYHEALQIATDIGCIPTVLDSLIGFAGMLARTGQQERALAYLGLASNHPAVLDNSLAAGKEILADLRVQLPPEQIEAGLERGKALSLEAVVAEVLAGADRGCE